MLQVKYQNAVVLFYDLDTGEIEIDELEIVNKSESEFPACQCSVMIQRGADTIQTLRRDIDIIPIPAGGEYYISRSRLAASVSRDIHRNIIDSSGEGYDVVVSLSNSKEPLIRLSIQHAIDRQKQKTGEFGEMRKKLEELQGGLREFERALASIRQEQTEQKRLMKEELTSIRAHLQDLDNEILQATPQPKLHWELSEEQIHLGENFELLVTMTNQGGVDADGGGITVSFPSVTRFGEEAEITFESDIDESNGWIHERGETVWGGDAYDVMPNRPIDADYLMIEPYKSPWLWREERFLKLLVCPKQRGEFPIYVNGWIMLGEYHAVFRTPKVRETSTIDQQVHPVYALTVKVI